MLTCAGFCAACRGGASCTAADTPQPGGRRRHRGFPHLLLSTSAGVTGKVCVQTQCPRCRGVLPGPLRRDTRRRRRARRYTTCSCPVARGGAGGAADPAPLAGARPEVAPQQRRLWAARKEQPCCSRSGRWPPLISAKWRST